jgi:hypothetical protein
MHEAFISSNERRLRGILANFHDPCDYDMHNHLNSTTFLGELMIIGIINVIFYFISIFIAILSIKI